MSSIRSSIESEPALVLGPLRSLEEQRQEQQLQEIELRRQERERRAQEAEDGGDSQPPIQERADELTSPFHYEFSYWARAGERITVTPSSKELLFYPPEIEATITGGQSSLPCYPLLLCYVIVFVCVCVWSMVFVCMSLCVVCSGNSNQKGRGTVDSSNNNYI